MRFSKMSRKKIKRENRNTLKFRKGSLNNYFVVNLLSTNWEFWNRWCQNSHFWVDYKIVIIHHHHLCLKRPFLPCSARVRRFPRYGASPNIFERTLPIRWSNHEYQWWLMRLNWVERRIDSIYSAVNKPTDTGQKWTASCSISVLGARFNFCLATWIHL